MGLRDTLNNNPAVATAAAAAILLICLLWLGWGYIFGPSNSPAPIVYYDVTNQQIKLVEYSSSSYPSSPLDGSPDVYQATVYACGQCPEEGVTDGMTAEDLKAKGMYIGWLSRTSQNATDQFESPTEYSNEQGKQWVSSTSESGLRLTQAAESKCPDGTAVQCFAK